MIPNDVHDSTSDSGNTEVEQPLSSMDFANDSGFDLNTSASTSRHIDRNALVLVLIIAATVIGLWSMRTLSPSMASDVNQVEFPSNVSIDPIDNAIIERLAAPAIGVRDFTVDRDPFKAWTPAPITNEAALIEEFVDDGIVDRATMCADWQTEVNEIAGMLTLKSVLGGGTPRALVNIEGVLLTIGETFDIAETQLEFRVEGTGRRSVRLSAYNSGIDCWHEVLVSMDVD
jgi:hypothetical protein